MRPFPPIIPAILTALTVASLLAAAPVPVAAQSMQCQREGANAVHFLASLQPPLSVAQNAQVCQIVANTKAWMLQNRLADSATKTAHMRSAVAQVRAVLTPAQQPGFDAKIARIDPRHLLQ